MEFLVTKKARRCAARGEEDNASHSARAQACVQAHTYDYVLSKALDVKTLDGQTEMSKKDDSPDCEFL